MSDKNENVEELFDRYRDQNGLSIREHSFAAPLMLVLLRHVGCSFCRETLNELSSSLKYITDCGYRVGLVHMDQDEHMQDQLSQYKLQHLPRFRDSKRILYEHLGLTRAPLHSVFKTDIWKKAFQAKKEYGASWPKTDPRQLPGVFVVDQGLVVAGESTLSPEEQPDFLALLIRTEAVA